MPPICPADEKALSIAQEKLSKLAITVDDPALVASVQGIISAVFGNSPYLSKCLLQEAEFTANLLKSNPDKIFYDLLCQSEALAQGCKDITEIMSVLRRTKQCAALLIALADISEHWDVLKVTNTLSRLAAHCLRLASTFLLRRAVASGKLILPPEAFLPYWDGSGSGLIILAVGKFGAGELNYSSDIDLIILYDERRAKVLDPDGPGHLFIRIARDLVRIMDEKTHNGYVFRTDLRLRPDPGATPAAMSVLAAEDYYTSVGQNWERAAMIKVRAVAGDPAAGNAYIDFISGWIWRRSLDFAAIEDIHAIKRQIAAHRGHDEVKIAGHNIKLGRGGIREIEFFVQTQQLIYGGRDPDLRKPATLDALDALTEKGWVNATCRDDLRAAYLFLRKVEHRLQMIEDRQTHTLPKLEEELLHLANFLGYQGIEAFTQELLRHLRRVEHHYARLFDDAPALSGPGNLVFTGVEDDPETICTLKQMGFEHPKAVSATVRGWHHGRTAATRSERARQLLTALMPNLLTELAATPHPDMAFATFDKFLSGQPAGVQLLSLLHQNRPLLSLLAEIMGTAPNMADFIAARPSVLDSLLGGAYTDPLPPRDDMRKELERLLHHSSHYEYALDVIRRWAWEKRFIGGVQVILGISDGDRSSSYLAEVAELSLNATFVQCRHNFAEKHGELPGEKDTESAMAIMAYGKLGSGHMSFGSDLDLVMIYDVRDEHAQSDGPKPLSPGTYYTRLTQRLISAITAQTTEGRLDEVDLRLRPFGNDGPPASRLNAWMRYYRQDAWTWELMALTRARAICGSDRLRAQLEAARRNILAQKRDKDQLRREISEMRSRILKTHPDNNKWLVKHTRGGFIDVEFAVQFMMLAHAVDYPQILARDPLDTLIRLEQTGLLSTDDCKALETSYRMCRRVQNYQRLTEGPGQPHGSPAFQRAIAHAVTKQNNATFDEAETLLRETLDRAYAVYERLL